MGSPAILAVKITGNAGEAVKAFEHVTRKAAAFGSFVGNVAAKGVEKLWGKLTSFSSDVVNMSDSVDKFKNTLRFAGLDTSAVDKAARAARSYADETVYGLDDIQNTMAQLAANGVKNYTEITQAAGNLNAVAGGNADTFKSVTMALTQTIGAGKLTTENWNQIADAIPGASGKLQEAMRKNNAFTGDFRDAMAKGQITAEEFSKALTDLGMTDVAKQAATSTQTIEGALGNLEAAVTGGLMDVFNLVKPAVTGAMNTATTAVESFATKGVNGLKAFTTAFTGAGALETGRVMLEDIGRAGKALAGAFGALVRAVNPFTGGIKDAGDAGSAAGEMFNTLSEYVGAVSNRIQAAAGWLNRMASALRDTGAANALAGVLDRLKPLLQSVSDAAGAMARSFLPSNNAMHDAAGVGTMLGNAMRAGANLVSGALDVIRQAFDWIETHAELVRAALIALGGGFAAVKGYQALTNGFNTLAGAMKGVEKTATTVFDGIGKMQDMGGVIGSLKSMAGNLNIVKGAQAAWNGVTKAATAVQLAFNAAMDANPIGIIITAIGALVAALTWFFTQTDTGRRMWGAFMDWLKGVWESLLPVLRPIIDAIVNLWNSCVEFVKAVWEALQPILEPIAQALLDVWNMLVDAVGNIWQSVVDFIVGLWNTFSPILEPIITAIQAAWQTCGDAVRVVWETVSSAFQTICSIIGGIIDALTALIRGDFSGAANAVRGIWNAIGGFFSGLINRIAGFFANLGGRIGNVFNSAGNAVKSVWNNVVAWIQGIPGRIIGIFAGAGSWLWDAGSRIISGLWDGLKSAWGNVTSWVSGLGDWIKAHKGPPAYDAILLKGNGKLIMQGFAKGLKTGFENDVVPTIKGVNTKLSSMNFNDMIAGASAIVYQDNRTTKFDVRFDGVVTDPEATARQINRLLDDYSAKRR